METRTIPELLQVMIDNEASFPNGLCGLNDRLFIFFIFTENEYNLMDKYLKANLPPKIFSERNGEFPMFCFPYGEWPPRKEWLEQQILTFKS